jgi:hypothetical protein
MMDDDTSNLIADHKKTTTEAANKQNGGDGTWHSL